MGEKSGFAKCASDFSRHPTKFRNHEWPLLACLPYENIISASSSLGEKMCLREAAFFVRPALEVAARMVDSFKRCFPE